MSTRTYGPGEIVTARFSDGRDLRTADCSDCYCECHDDGPLPPGIYITVRLDDDEARVGMGRVRVLSEGIEVES
jgi:hypothetical protein